MKPEKSPCSSKRFSILQSLTDLRGELVALTWDDIEFQNHTASVERHNYLFIQDDVKRRTYQHLTRALKMLRL